MDISGFRTSNGIIESLLGKVASLVWRVEDLVVEDGEVQGKAETDWVSWCKIALGNLGGGLVSLEGLVGGLLALVADGELSEVAVVVTLPGVDISMGQLTIRWDQRTSCGRRPWTLRTERMGSSACQGHRGYPRRS